MALAKWQERELAKALEKLEALIDPDSSKCTLPDDVKRAVRPYVSTWIIPYLECVVNNQKPRRPTGW